VGSLTDIPFVEKEKFPLDFFPKVRLNTNFNVSVMNGKFRFNFLTELTIFVATTKISSKANNPN